MTRLYLFIFLQAASTGSVEEDGRRESHVSMRIVCLTHPFGLECVQVAETSQSNAMQCGRVRRDAKQG